MWQNSRHGLLLLLQGLIPRASQLLQLGATVFLAFGPFILAVLLTFAALYGVSVLAGDC